MTDQTIAELRSEVDNINLEILAALSKRAETVKKIGARQTEMGITHFDPKRESVMLEALEKANPGVFSNSTIKQLFKEIFKASLDLEEREDKPKLKYSRKVHPQDSAVVISRGSVSVQFGGGVKTMIAGPCSIESLEQTMQAAEIVKRHGITMFRGGAYKPRTSPYGFQGLGVPEIERAHV